MQASGGASPPFNTSLLPMNPHNRNGCYRREKKAQGKQEGANEEEEGTMERNKVEEGKSIVACKLQLPFQNLKLNWREVAMDQRLERLAWRALSPTLRPLRHSLVESHSRRQERPRRRANKNVLRQAPEL